VKSVPINLDEVVSQTVQSLGAQVAQLTLELNAERAASAAFRARIEELEAAEEESMMDMPPAEDEFDGD
jgi:outer membrane murein-binding lipoprotein Lpp